MRKLIISFLLCILFFSYDIQAQNTGFNRKRIAVKYNINTVWHLGAGATVEVPVVRKMSVFLEFNYTTKRLLKKENYNVPDFKSRNYIAEKEFAIGTKIYLSKAFNAPKGGYLYARYGFGFVNLVYYDEYKDEFTLQTYLDKITIRNIPFHHAEVGIGKQYIFFKHMIFDFAWGLQFGIITPKKTAYGSYYEKYMENHGGNIYAGPYGNATIGASARIGLGYIF